MFLRLRRLYDRYVFHHLKGAPPHSSHSHLRMMAKHVALWPRLALRVLMIVPLLADIKSPQTRAQVIRRLGLSSHPPAPPVVLCAKAVLPRSCPAEIAIILPVHNASDLVLHCLDRIQSMTELPWRLVIVEDGSTDPDLRSLLKTWMAHKSNIALICHETPKGFAGAVNAGLAQLQGFPGPVVLLNTDVSLPRDWASRLCAPLLADTRVASVTPLSNEGELMGAPHACVGVSLRNGEVDAVDRALEPFAQEVGLPVLPTGTGFCMAVSPRWLQKVPRFEESFGRGYGEEVDWCQKTRALGARHVCQTGLFVGHVGAASFGRQARQELRARSAPVLSKRWPRFDHEVAQTLLRDPLIGDRLRAGLLWAKARSDGAALPVYLAHGLGGGTAHWLEQRLRSHDIAMVLRVGGALRWQLELHTQAGVTCGATDSFFEALMLLQLVGPRDVIYACAVGDPVPEDIPRHLLELCAGGHRLEVLFHDYFPINRDYTFRSEPEADWIALWRPALERAAQLTVFSKASRDIVQGVIPDLADKLRECPHVPLGPVPVLAPVRSGQPVIGVLGNLNAQKGARVVADLARVFARSGEARLVVLGKVAPDCPMPRSVTVVDGYQLEDIPHLVMRHGIGFWLVPSLWPETFSYVTQEALMTGLPTVGFDLGGQGEALRGQDHGYVVTLQEDGSVDLEALLIALRALPKWPVSAVKIVSKQAIYKGWKRVGV